MIAIIVLISAVLLTVFLALNGFRIRSLAAFFLAATIFATGCTEKPGPRIREIERFSEMADEEIDQAKHDCYVIATTDYNCSNLIPPEQGMNTDEWRALSEKTKICRPKPKPQFRPMPPWTRSALFRISLTAAMSRICKIARTLLLSLALTVLPLSGCTKTLSIPVSASYPPNSELTDCFVIQTELRELEPLVRSPFDHNETPLNVLAFIAAISAIAGGVLWADAKTTDPDVFTPGSSHADKERMELEDDEQFWKGTTYASLAVFAASLGLNLALDGISEQDKAEQATMRKRISALRRMRAKNDCVNYDAQ